MTSGERTISIPASGSGDARETTSTIQEAVDRLAGQGGGVCELSAGCYELDNAVFLRDGVVLRGQGDTTVLRPVPSFSSALRSYAGYGHYDVQLDDVDGFRVGMGVHITDDRAGGFYDTTATLTWHDDDRFGIDHSLSHDYLPECNARITAVFPVVAGIGVVGAKVESLQITGPQEMSFHLNGCRGGGVYLLAADDIEIRNVNVYDYPGDGISFQQCRRTVIEDCRLESNIGHGLHPGSGSVAPVMRRVTCKDNGWCGVFYCLRVTYSVLEDSTIIGNGQAGLSIGAHDTDNLIRECRIEDNNGPGVYWRPDNSIRAGHRITLVNNALACNARKCETTRAEIDIAAAASGVCLTGNTITPADGVVTIHKSQGVVDLVVAENNHSFEPEWVGNIPEKAYRHLPSQRDAP